MRACAGAATLSQASPLSASSVHCDSSRSKPRELRRPCSCSMWSSWRASGALDRPCLPPPLARLRTPTTFFRLPLRDRRPGGLDRVHHLHCDRRGGRRACLTCRAAHGGGPRGAPRDRTALSGVAGSVRSCQRSRSGPSQRAIESSSPRPSTLRSAGSPPCAGAISAVTPPYRGQRRPELCRQRSRRQLSIARCDGPLRLRWHDRTAACNS